MKNGQFLPFLAPLGTIPNPLGMVPNASGMIPNPLGTTAN